MRFVQSFLKLTKVSKKISRKQLLLNTFFTIVIFHNTIRNNRRQNNRRNNIKRHAHFFTITNDEIREENAVNRFEIRREHDRIRREFFHHVDRSRECVSRTNGRQYQDVNPVDSRDIEECRRESPIDQQVNRNEEKTRKKLIQTDHGRIVFLDQLAVKNRKHHTYENRKQRTQHARKVFDFDIHNHAQTRDDDEPE